VFCQYTFWGLDESIVVPPEIHSETGESDDAKMFVFKHFRVSFFFLIFLIVVRGRHVAVIIW
jgi:hypothetical protein